MTQGLAMDELLEKAIQEVAANHRKIIEDWCKAYMAQLYEEGHDLKPGCFTLYEQRNIDLSNGKIGNRYWFEKEVPHYYPQEQELNDDRIQNNV